MIKTEAAIKREQRNAEIKRLYKKYMSQKGSMRSAVLDKISIELNVSVTTAHRVTK